MTDLIHRIIMWIVFAVLFAGFPLSVSAAPCSTWDVSGEVIVHQSNGFDPVLTLYQEGRRIGGDAHYENAGGVNGVVTSGSNMAGQDFTVVIQWDNKTRGSYTGAFRSDGKLAGTTSDEQHAGSIAIWYSDRTFACLQMNKVGIPPRKVNLHGVKVGISPRKVDIHGALKGLGGTKSQSVQRSK